MMTIKSINWRKWLNATFALFSIVFFIYYLATNFDEIPPLNYSGMSIIIGIITVLIVVFSIGIVAFIWQLLLSDHGVTISWKQAQTIFAIAQFGKYLPGNIGQHVGRVVMAQDIGIPVPIVLNTMVVEVLWGLAVAGGLALIAMYLFIDGHVISLHWQYEPLRLSLIVALLLLMPWLGIGFLNRCMPGLAKRLSGGGSISAPSLRSALAVGVLFVLCFSFMGLILKLQAQWFFNVSEGNLFELTCLFSIAWLVGYIMPGAPGGLGVREAMMVFVLSPVLGVGASVGLSVTLRLTTTLGDALTFIFGILGRKYMLLKSVGINERSN